MNSSTISHLIEKNKEKIKYASIQHPVIQKVKCIQNNSSDDSERLFVAEGIWAHQKLIKTDLRLRYFVCCPELIYSAEGTELAEEFIYKAEETFIVSKKTFEKISDRDGPDGFSCVVQNCDFSIDKLRFKDNALIVVLDGLENPGNIGTILRTCDGAGVDAVFICNKKARMTNPKLVKE